MINGKSILAIVKIIIQDSIILDEHKEQYTITSVCSNKSIDQESQSNEPKFKSSPRIQRNKKSFLPSPPHTESSPENSTKTSSRPKSFSSFFQHLETKYFPYKQQLSYDPPSPNLQKQNIPEIGPTKSGNDIHAIKESTDELSVRQKKQKKSSMFKNFFMSSSSSNQHVSQTKFDSGNNTPKSKTRKNIVQIPDENKSSARGSTPLDNTNSKIDNDGNGSNLSELKKG